jgi:hypothetical protein
MYNFIEQYGSVTLEEVRAYVATYVGTPTRLAQNSNQIYACLSESLLLEAKNKVGLEKASYTINGDFCGLLYFKVIVGLKGYSSSPKDTIVLTGYQDC